MRRVKSCCVCLFVFFSRSFCEWLRKQVSTLNQSSRQNLLMGRRRQEQGIKLKNQRQVQTATLRLALAGMYTHLQQPFCIFIFKRVLPKCCQGGKDNPNEVVSDHYFLSQKSNVIFVFKLNWTLCVFVHFSRSDPGSESWCLLAACRTSGDRSSQWRRPRWCPNHRLVADLAAAQGSLHQALALRPQKPQGLLSSGDNRDRDTFKQEFPLKQINMYFFVKYNYIFFFFVKFRIARTCPA